MEYHEPQPNEQREKHTAETIKAVGMIEGAFREIDRLNPLLNDKDLKIQELQNGILMANSRLGQ